MDDNGRGAVSPDEGGDPVCWIDQVCPECGRILVAERTERECPTCQAASCVT